MRRCQAASAVPVREPAARRSLMYCGRGMLPTTVVGNNGREPDAMIQAPGVCSYAISVTPIIEDMEHSGDGIASALHGIIEVCDRLDNFRVAHVSPVIVVLANGKDAVVARV